MTGPLDLRRRAAPLLAGIGRDVTVLDVRYRMGGPPGPEEYAAGHVPGAAYVDLDTRPGRPARRRAGGTRCRTPTVFEAAMRRAGVRGDRPVVVYDDWAGQAAGRAWWLLRYHGHPDVRVLDGGWSAWVRDGRRGGDRASRRAPAGRLHGAARASCRSSRPTTCSAVRRCWSTPGPPSATAARSSRSTRWPGTSRARSTCRPRANLADDGPVPPAGASCAALYAAVGATADGARRGRRRTAAPASPPPTTCSRWSWSASAPRSTRAAGASGSPTPADRSLLHAERSTRDHRAVLTRVAVGSRDGSARSA